MIKSDKHNTLIIVLHGLVWMMLFAFPYFFSSDQSFMREVMEHSWVPLLTYMLIFYINYFLLISRFLFTRKWVLFVILNLAIMFIFTEMRFEIRHLFMEARPLHTFSGKMPPPPRPLTFIFYLDFLAYTVPVVFATALKIYEKWISTEREKNDAVHANLTSELEQLKYQLQPHFFFNSLNNIYSMVDTSPEKAKAMIHSLGKLMRYLLHDANVAQTSLKQEMEFINRYIDLMEVRFTDNVKIYRQFQEINASIQIPPLLFISIVENAFKHGGSATLPSIISFSLELKDNHIHFSCSNTSYPKTQTDNSGSGIGLENLKKRLELLYKNQYLLTTKEENGQFLVQLVLTKAAIV